MNSDYDTLKAWADIVIKKWRVKINTLDVRHTTALVKSFIAEVHTQSGGNPEKVVFTYLYYGRFPDMGVGKGVPFDRVGKKGRRKAKNWMGKIFFNQIQRLGVIMAEKTGQKAVMNIIESWESIN